MATQAELQQLAVALNRFGLGARPDEQAPGDPKAWLTGQFDSFEPRPAAFSGLGGSGDIFREYAEDRSDFRKLDGAARMAARKELRQRGRKLYSEEVDSRAVAALTTPAPFVERLVHFWSNHFAVSVEKPQVAVLAGAFEREAVRPHVLGRFVDLVLAVERHPAMQFFLDQVRSVGPDSRRAEMVERRDAKRRPGINENLGREIMELHTLGVRTGYSQADVTQFALALTGWTIGGIGPAAGGAPGAFLFRPGTHEPGSRTVMGKVYGQKGEEQAEAVIRDICASEATASHVAFKLARHFIADDPPPAAVGRLKVAFLDGDGDLKTVYRALVEAPEAWQPRQAKFKTPWEWTISSLRALGRDDLGKMKIAQVENQLGQQVWRPGSPAGYDDIAASWAAPDALVRRVEISQRFARLAGPDTDPRQLAPAVLPGTLSGQTGTEIGRAESQQTALALLFVSPEFQRR